MSTTDDATKATSASSPQVRKEQRFSEFAEKYGLLVLLALVFAYFAANAETSEIFLSEANLVSLIRNQMVLLLIAYAALVPLMLGTFDLSPGAVAGVASIGTASAMSTHSLSWPVAVAVGLAIGLVLGVVQGVMVARFGLSAIIVTLASTTVLAGVMAAYTGGLTIAANIDLDFLDFGSLNWLGLPRPIFLILPITLILWYVEACTPLGRKADAIRSNPRAAQLVGIRTDRGKLGAFAASGLLAGMGGALMVSVSGAADSTSGPSYLFPALAAVFLGATVIKPGVPNVLGTVIGAFFVAISVSGLTLLGVSSWVSDVFNGSVLFLAAGLSTFFARRRGGGGPALM